MAEDMWEKYREERETDQRKGPKHGRQVNQRPVEESEQEKSLEALWLLGIW